MRTIPNRGQYLGILNIGWVFPATLGGAGGVLHPGNYSFVKPPLVTNDISNILKNKGCYLWSMRNTRGRGSCYCRISRVRGLRDWCLGFGLGVEITEKVAEVVVFPGAVSAVLVEMGGGCKFAMLDIIGSSGFSYEFRALGSPSMNDSSNAEESPAPS